MKTNLKFVMILFLLAIVINLSYSQTQVGSDIDGEHAGDISGLSGSLSSDGNRIAIGAPFNDGNGWYSGHVRVYDLIGGIWIQVGEDIDGEASNNHMGYSVSLSSDGSRLAAGATHNGETGLAAGHVRVYDLIGGVWTQVGIDIDAEAGGDKFGYSVSLSSDGNRLAAGATQNDEGGHVRVYDLIGGTWTQVGADIDGESLNDGSGESVSLCADGSRVAIGAPANDENGLLAGHVRIYDLIDGSWVQIGADIDGEDIGDQLGRSVCLSSDGSRLAIGAPYNDGNGTDAGHVRIYEWNGGSWIQLGDYIEGKEAGEEAGWSISFSFDGSMIAIGGIGNDDNGNNSGVARIYEFIGGVWTQVALDIVGEAADDLSGRPVALSSDGSQIAIGSLYNDGNGADAGHMRIFSIPCTPTTSTDVIIACEAYTWIDNNTYTASNDSATYTFTNANCDSIVTLNLTINTVDESVTDNSPTLMSNASGATYQWLDCNDGFDELAGETNQSFTAISNGSYAVMVSQNNCTDTSECITITNVSVLESNLESQLSIFPNPNSGQFQIDLGSVYSGISISVKNPFGQIVLSANNVLSQRIQLTIPGERGVYFVNIKTKENQLTVLKVLKL